MADNFEYDVFLSYSAKDKPVVRELAQRLKADGLRVWFDEWEIKSGDMIGNRIDEGLETSRVMVLAMSKHLFESDWATLESWAFRFRDPINKECRFIPLKLDDCNIPPTLRGLKYVDYQDKSEEALKKLLDACRPEITGGKGWLKAFESKIREFLQKIPANSTETIRVIGYSGVTTAEHLTQLLNTYKKHNTRLEVKVMLRSEYHGFTSRPLDPEYNRYIRWRISRAKACWYACADSLAKKNIFLQLRDYGWEPAPKALLLGSWGGAFGLYAVDPHHRLSDQPTIGPARDWIASDTDMAFLDSTQKLFLQNQIRWFNKMWDQSTKRSNECYRCNRSEVLWNLFRNKLQKEAKSRHLLERWTITSSKGSVPAVGNLSLPATHPETPNELIAVLGCTLVVKGTEKHVLITEIRNRGDTWEGISKTETYLDLLGLIPSAQLPPVDDKQKNWRESFSGCIRQCSVRWSQTNNNGSKFALVASDFIWAWVDQGRLKLTPPEGEILFGLWDVSRYILRKLVSQANHWQDGIQRALHECQEELFSKLPMVTLAAKYGYSDAPVVEPSLIVVLRKGTGPRTDDWISNKAEIREILRQVMQNSPHHPSPFWRCEEEKLRRHSEAVEKLVQGIASDNLPKVLCVSGVLPLGSLANLVRENISKTNM